MPNSPHYVSVPRFLRLKEIVGPKGIFPISRSSWWAGVKAGRFPQPIRLGSRTVAWREADLRALAERLGGSK
jgi:prophage regulatory protein